MVGTVVPMVYGLNNGGRRTKAHIAHLAGAVAGGAIVGVTSGLAGGLAGERLPAVLVIPAVLAVAYAFHELGLADLPMPQRHRQVPVSWRSTYSPSVAAAMYGVGLGVGWLTHITTASFYVACALVVAVGDPLFGALALGLYGFGRGLPPFVLASLSPSAAD